MKRLDHNTLLNWGRKAGLNTRELYSALAGRRFGVQDLETGETDGNGFVTDISSGGHPIYRPEPKTRR
jgi:hypothetical protein